LELECPFQGTSERLFALKRINLPNGWHDAAPSLGHAVWVEASRLAWCASYEVQFNAQAAHTSTVVYGQCPCRQCYCSLTHYSSPDFNVVPTFLLLGPNWEHAVQPWSSGVLVYKSKARNPLERHSAAETLDAFTHFTHEFSNHQLIVTDFEGKDTFFI